MNCEDSMNCRPSKPRLRSAEQGAALVVAMLVFALASTLVVAMQKEFTLFLKRGSNAIVAEQADAYLRGGEDLAALVLREDWRADKENESLRDDLSERWAEEVPPYALDEGGWLLGKLEDLQGRFNINSLATEQKQEEGGGKKQRYTSSQRQFIRLLQALENLELSQQEAIAITEAVTDWLDRNGEPGDNGAEDGFYYDRSPSYRVANTKMYSVSELRSVANMTPEIFAALAPVVTVWSEDHSINVHTAPLAVLRSINEDKDLSPLSASEGETLEEERGEDGFENLDAMLSSPILEGRNLGDLRNRLGEVSDSFLFIGQVEVADRVTRLYSVLQRDRGEGIVRALVRASGSI